MSGLILKLRPRERLMINGVIVENGDRKTRLYIKTEGADILRLRDAIAREDATTPLLRAYFTAQQAVAGQIDKLDAAALLKTYLNDHLANNRQASEIAPILSKIDASVFFRPCD